MLLSVNVGPNSPDWLYSKGVPQVFTDGHDKEAGPYPYYLDPLYQSRYNSMINKFGEYTRSLPSRLFERIAYVQVKTGSTGDEEAYKGEVNLASAAHSISESDFDIFRLASFKTFHFAFQLGPGKAIPLMFAKISKDDVPENPYQALLDWIIATVKIKWGTKMNGSGQGYQLNGEAWRTRPILSHVVDPTLGEYNLFTRCEMDQGWQRGGIFPINNKQAFYWTAISAVHSGLTMWNMAVSAIEWHREVQYWEDFEFFNRYAGQTLGAEATGAFCALREGLDTDDTDKFPVTTYGGATGSASKKFNERAVKICASRAARGAKIDDLAGASKGMMFQRREQVGLNDVGEEIFRGNYERFLSQIDPDTTSVGLWRVGGEVTSSSSVYGRFARGFEHVSGKDKMGFRLTDSFFGGGPLAGAYSVTVRVMYYDTGRGRWALYYDAVGNPNKKAYEVLKTDTKEWKEKVVTLSDANFGKSGEMGSDLSLVNVDAEDDIFHMVEITRPDWCTTPNTASPSKASPGKSPTISPTRFGDTRAPSWTSSPTQKIEETPPPWTKKPAFMAAVGAGGCVLLGAAFLVFRFCFRKSSSESSKMTEMVHQTSAGNWRGRTSAKPPSHDTKRDKSPQPTPFHHTQTHPVHQPPLLPNWGSANPSSLAPHVHLPPPPPKRGSASPAIIAVRVNPPPPPKRGSATSSTLAGPARHLGKNVGNKHNELV